MGKHSRKTMRSLQADAMKEKLQTIVREMATVMPLDEIRIRDIAEKADISVGNFYQYFPNKEAALVYSYKVKDLEWEQQNFEQIKDPLERLQVIIVTHLKAMTEQSFCFDTQLYIAQLKHYDEYFFRPDRYLPSSMNRAIQEAQEIGLIRNDYEPDEITRRLLTFSRGLVYSYCIRHVDDSKEFLEFSLVSQEEYLTIFVKDSSQIRLKYYLEQISK